MSRLPRPSLDFLTLLSATVKGGGAYLCREDPSAAPGTEVLFREGETQAPEGNQLASPVDTAAPGDSTHCKQEPRGRMGRCSLGPHCLCFQERCPRGCRRAYGRTLGLLNCSLRMRGSQLAPALDPPRLWGVTPPWPDQGDPKIRLEAALEMSQWDPKPHSSVKDSQQALTLQPQAQTLHQKGNELPKTPPGIG